MNGVGVKGIGIVFNRKSGKPVTTLDGYVTMLKMYGMQNLTATRDYVVVGIEDNLIYAYMEGTGKGTFPTIHKDMEGMNAKKIGIDTSLF